MSDRRRDAGSVVRLTTLTFEDADPVYERPN